MNAKLLVLISTCFLCSCATIFNSRKTTTVYTATPVDVTVNNQKPVHVSNIPFQFEPDKNEKVIPITFATMTDTVHYKLYRKLSPWLLMNIITPYMGGFVVDLTNKRRFTFHKNLYVFHDEHTLRIDKDRPESMIAKKRRNAFKWSPVRILNLLDPGLQFSYEYKYLKNMSFEIHATKLFNMNPVQSYRNAFEVGIEHRYYFSTNPRSRGYFGLETGYYRKEIQRELWFLPEKEDNSGYRRPYRDDVIVDREKYRVIPKIGYQFVSNVGFLLEVYGGIGIAKLDIRHRDRDNPKDEWYEDDNNYVMYWRLKQRSDWLPAVALNFKIGYSF